MLFRLSPKRQITFQVKGVISLNLNLFKGDCEPEALDKLGIMSVCLGLGQMAIHKPL